MKTAQKYHQRVVHTLYKEVAFDTAAIGVGVPFEAAIPAGAFIIEASVHVTEAFDAGTTNVLTVGTNSAAFTDIVVAADVDESSATVQRIDGPGVLSDSADLTPFVKFTETGTAATAGKATVVLQYAIPDLDPEA